MSSQDQGVESGAAYGLARLVAAGDEPDTSEGFDRTAAQLRGVLRFARSLATMQDEQTLFQIVANTARSALGYSACVVAMRGDDGNFHNLASAGVLAAHEVHNLVVSPAAFEALTNASITLGGVHWVPPGHAVREREDVKAAVMGTGVSVPSRTWQPGSLLFAPLIGSDGEAIGFINPDDPLSGDLPVPEQALMLETLAELTVVGLEIVRARSTERAARAIAEEQRTQLEALMAASARVRGDMAIDEVLQSIVRAMSNAGGFNRAAIYLLGDDDVLEARATIGLSPEEDAQLRANPVSLAEFAPAMQPGMLISRSYLLDHRRFSIPAELDAKLNTPRPHAEWQEGMWHVEDMLTVPFVAPSGEVLGLISLDEPKNGLLPDRAHVQALEFFADQCANAVQHSRRFEAVRAEAETDVLTGLYNRRALVTSVNQAIDRFKQRAERSTLLFIDIDHFKLVNDTFGHSQGDLVLQWMANALSERLRKHDMLARYGGEEFVALLRDTELEEGVALAEALRERIVSLDSTKLTGDLPMRISIGVAAITRDSSAADVLAASDAAMYEAKRRGRNQVRVARTDGHLSRWPNSSVTAPDDPIQA
jgi:diguanylate cyclase (GGDEF)-like protein